MSREVNVKVKVTEECPICHGKGYWVEEGKGVEGFHRCTTCRGDAELKSTQTKTVTIDD